MTAAEFGLPDVIELLLATHPDVNMCKADGSTALHIAADPVTCCSSDEHARLIEVARSGSNVLAPPHPSHVLPLTATENIT